MSVDLVRFEGERNEIAERLNESLPAVEGVNCSELSEKEVVALALQLETLKIEMMEWKEALEQDKPEEFRPKRNPAKPAYPSKPHHPEKPKTEGEQRAAVHFIFLFLGIVLALFLIPFGIIFGWLIGWGLGTYICQLIADLSGGAFATPRMFVALIGAFLGLLIPIVLAVLAVHIPNTLYKKAKKSPPGPEVQAQINEWERGCAKREKAYREECAEIDRQYEAMCEEVRKENETAEAEYRNMLNSYEQKKAEYLRLLDSSVPAVSSALEKLYRESLMIPSKYYGNTDALQHVFEILCTSQYTLKEALNDYELTIQHELDERLLRAQQEQNALLDEQNDLIDRQNEIARRARRDANIHAVIGHIQRYKANKSDN
ncbi:MAG: ABC transporter permease [Lachnospiraceae bacterium]|nr:ABC transporter permease [Lachnospiraceae bacterium]